MNAQALHTRVLSGLILGGLLCVSRGAAQSDEDFNRGVSEFRAGNYSAAVTLFARAETAAPGSTPALLYEAKSQVHLEDFIAAERSLRTYLAAHADSADARYLLGFVLHRQNRPAESLATYTQAAALVPPTGDDLKIVGLDYVLLDDYPDAIRWLEKAVDLDPKNKDAWYYLGRAYYTKARVIAARRAFSTVLTLDPRDARAENNLGLTFESDAQPEAAIDAYRKAIDWQQQSPHPSQQPYVNLGSLLLEQGRADDAIPPLEKSVTLAPNSGFCRLKLGTAYLRAGRLTEAQEELEKATSLEPENAVAHYQLGRLYKERHALDRAQAEFDRAAQLQARAAGSVLPSSDH
jgi:Tfp pilus assembly protein PilF